MGGDWKQFWNQHQYSTVQYRNYIQWRNTLTKLYFFSSQFDPMQIVFGLVLFLFPFSTQISLTFLFKFQSLDNGWEVKVVKSLQINYIDIFRCPINGIKMCVCVCVILCVHVTFTDQWFFVKTLQLSLLARHFIVITSSKHN